LLKKIISRLQKRFRTYSAPHSSRPDIENDLEFQEIYRRVWSQNSKYTMTSMERCYSLYSSIQYITKANIPGDVIECGVWRGGSAMLSALTLIKNNQNHRKIYLYDTYEGMSEPTNKDIDIQGVPYRQLWEQEKGLLSVPIDEVKKNMLSTGYPEENIIFVEGMVEKTIPNTVPSLVSLLRLDTDLYESTYHELIHLYPKIASQGILIIDDYGHFQGAREATEKYFSESNYNIFLQRIDYTCRVGVKP